MQVTEKEKTIYNLFLAASRSIQNKPFTFRKDFSKIDDTTYILLKKLNTFFSKYPHINIQEYFTAPYKYYGTDSYFDLHYFTTAKAIKCFSLFQKQKETQDPDNENVINDCKAACSFIYKFCLEHKLTLNQYKTYTSGSVPDLIQHLKDHKINFYILHGLECEHHLRRVENDLINFIIEDFDNTFNKTRQNFLKSKKLKHTVRKALSIIENKLIITKPIIQ